MTAVQAPLLDLGAGEPSPEQIDRERMRAHLDAHPPKLVGLPPEREPGQHGPLPTPGRSVYTGLTPQGARSRLAMALRAGAKKFPLLHRAAVLHRDHGDWARAELHRLRADGTARTWGVDVEALDAVLDAAGVSAAGEQIGLIPGAEP